MPARKANAASAKIATRTPNVRGYSLEARGELVRDAAAKPLRWRRTEAV